jgi:hypothetical protein
MAVSLATFDPVPYDPAAEVALRIAKRFLEKGLPPKTLLNVNVPPGPIESLKGLKLTKLGHRVFTDIIAPRVDPRGRAYYWVAGTAKWAPEERTDIDAIQKGYISVTPLNMDMTTTSCWWSWRRGGSNRSTEYRPNGTRTGSSSAASIQARPRDTGPDWPFQITCPGAYELNCAIPITCPGAYDLN